MSLITGIEGNANIMLPQSNGRMQGAVGRIMDDIYLMVDPTGREADIAETSLQRASAVSQIIKILKESNPGMSPTGYAVQAYGIYMGPGRADRFLDVLAKAEQLDDGSPKMPPEDLSESFKVAFADKCSNECDEDIRILWAKLLNGERERPGTYSKRTMDILSSLDRVTVERFQKLCSTCLGPAGYSVSPSISAVVPLLEYDEGSTSSINGGLLELTDLHELETAGLVFTGVHRTFNVAEILFFGINGQPYMVRNATENNIDLLFDKAYLSDAGEQLLNLCDVGSFEGLPSLFAKKARNANLTPFRVKPGQSAHQFVLEEIA